MFDFFSGMKIPVFNFHEPSMPQSTIAGSVELI